MRIYTVSVEKELEILRRKSVPVQCDEETVTFTKDLVKALARTKKGIGLAAPQIGVNKRIFIVNLDRSKDPLIFINPEKVEASTTLSGYEEGCLSIPDTLGYVKRPATITVQARDLAGQSFTLEAKGLLSTCIQHEMDHLDGVLFTDYLEKSASSDAPCAESS